MNRTNQSEQSSTSEREHELWFTKSNYMGDYLNEESRNIINKIKNRKSYG